MQKGTVGMSYKSKKSLLAEIEVLKEELSLERHKTRKTAFIDAAALPECKDLSCINCAHFVAHRTLTGAIYPLGCGAKNNCPDFVQTNNPITEAEKLLLTQEMLQQSLL